MPFACIFVPEFSVQAVLRAEPELRLHPLAVLEGKAPLQRVFALNQEARRLGIGLGMTRVQVETCGSLALRPRSSPAEAETHTALLKCAQTFSPRVEDCASDTFLLDLAGLQALFGSSARIAHDLQVRISSLGLEANIATAANANAATLAAHGFPGITNIPEGNEAQILGDLPVHVLFEGEHGFQPGRAEQLLETLQRWGIHDLRSLAALPEVALSERMGQEGVSLQRLARGALGRDLVALEEPPVFEAEIELEYPLVLLEPLAFLLNQLLEKICSCLAECALATQELKLQLELDVASASRRYLDEDTVWNAPSIAGGTPALPMKARHPGRPENAWQSFTRVLRLPVPLCDPRVFLKLLQLDLNANPPGAPIRKVHLTAKPARPRAAQTGLFLPPSPEPERLELTLARIAGIVGENQAGALELLDTHRTEGFRMQRFAPCEPHEASDSLHKPRKSAADLPERDLDFSDYKAILSAELQTLDLVDQGAHLVTALRMFRPPLRATVILRDGKPGHITCPKRETTQGEILWTAGPWRSSGDWWEHEGWARDEWDIAVQEKSGIALYRLVRDLLRGQWLVEGSYD